MDRDDLKMITDGLERILGDASLEAIDKDGGLGAGADALWATLEENGYPRLCASPEHGGFGASLADACELATIVGRHALALPLADSILANGLLSACGVEPPSGRIGLADPLDLAAPLPHAMQLEAFVALDGGRLRCVRSAPDNVRVLEQAEDGAGYVTDGHADTVHDAVAPSWLTPHMFQALAALIRSASMAGAMQAVLDLTLSYTREREQFGRPLAKFQAIQHHLSDIACETAASIAAVELASDALRSAPEPNSDMIDEIAIAKIRCGQAATTVAAAAHQAHGAMGFTREYALGRFTRRLWQWQDEFGTETEWATRLGNTILAGPNPNLWLRISKPI